MMVYKKSISLMMILALLLVTPQLFACSGDTANDNNDSDSDISEASESKEDIEVQGTGASVDSDYVIVYDSKLDALETYAKDLAMHIKGMYDIELEVYSDAEAPAEKTKRIIIGDTGDDIDSVKSKIGAENDFIADVLGDDIVLYSSADCLYGYLVDVTRIEFFTGIAPVVNSKDSFTYRNSKYSEKNYAQYMRDTKGSLTKEDLLMIFEARSFTAADGTTLPYRIYVPTNYEKGKTPLLLYLHGAGERGSDNAVTLTNVMPDAFSHKNSPYANAIIIIPQCPVGNKWVDTDWTRGNYSVENVSESNELKAVLELVDEIGEQYAPDRDRYYVMGLSMGGFGTWDLIMRHTEMFAAAIPICGGADPTQAEKLTELPIWTAHGTADPTVPYSGTKAMSDAIAATGSAVFKFSSLEGVNHHAWEPVSRDIRYGEWLFAQKRASHN